MQRLLPLSIGIILCLAPLGAHAQAVVSEVLWMGDDLSTSNEWFEIAAVPCGTAECPPVDLGGWSVTYLNSSGVEAKMLTLPAGLAVSGGHPVVVAKHGATSSRLADEPDVVDAGVSLPNSKLLLKLFDASGTLIDTVDDGVGAPFAGANPSGGAKASMERISLSGRGDDKDNWRTSTASSGFDDGAPMFGTPGSVEEPQDDPPAAPPPASGSASSPPQSGSGGQTELPPSAEQPRVIIFGAMPNPAGPDEAGEWIELKNLSQAPAVLAGWKLIGKGSSVKTFSLDGISIDAFSTLRLPFSQTQLSLTNTKFTLLLEDAYGLQASEVSWESAGEDRVYRPNMYTDLSLHATVSRVIDGDTLDVVFDQEATPDARQTATIRLIGVDAPESVHPTIKPQPYGKEASDFLRGLLEGKKVELEFDTNNWDIYDRMLAYVTVDEQLLAQERLLSTGMAKVYPDYPFARRGLFDQYEAQAKAQKVGIWSSPAATSEYKAPTTPVGVQSSAAVTAVANDAVASTAQYMPVAASDPAWALVVLSEVYAHPLASTPPGASGSLLASEWIEVRNTALSPLTMSGWSVRVGEGAKAKNYAFRTAVTVSAHGYALLTADISKFKLRDDGNTVALVAPDGTVVSSAAYPALKAGRSWLVDAAGGCISPMPGPGTGNACETEAAGVLVVGPVSRSAAKSSAPGRKTTAKKQPSPQFVLAQGTLESLRSPGAGVDLAGDGGSGFWQALTFLIGAVSLCQGALVCLMAWKNGMFGTRREPVPGT